MNDQEWIRIRNEAVKSAEQLELQVISIATFDVSEETFDHGSNQYESVISQYIQEEPDALVLIGTSPGDTPLIVKYARENGFKRLIAAQNALEFRILNKLAGHHAKGLVVLLGGASAFEIQSDYMKQFVERYRQFITGG
ncbi:MAG: ABC transporter substrate-binding protein [Gammaproteobacteria bacterium]|nr:ABC transporter substrate-binding protein [Gammaproteobacteria bacterium]